MRNSVQELAIAGAPPTFQSPLHVGRPNIGNRERLMERINDMLDRRWLSNAGVYVNELEQRLAELEAESSDDDPSSEESYAIVLI